MKPVMYLGEVVDFRGRIIQLFREKNGKACHFSGRIKGVWFGSVYKTNEDGSIKTRPELVETQWEPSEAERLAYEANKITVKVRREQKRKELKIKKPHAD